jgi:hypothetical protein
MAVAKACVFISKDPALFQHSFQHCVSAQRCVSAYVTLLCFSCYSTVFQHKFQLCFSIVFLHLCFSICQLQHLCSSICDSASVFQFLFQQHCVPAFLCFSICVPAFVFQHLCSSICVQHSSFYVPASLVHAP